MASGGIAIAECALSPVWVCLCGRFVVAERDKVPGSSAARVMSTAWVSGWCSSSFPLLVAAPKPLWISREEAGEMRWVPWEGSWSFARRSVSVRGDADATVIVQEKGELIRNRERVASSGTTGDCEAPRGLKPHTVDLERERWTRERGVESSRGGSGRGRGRKTGDQENWEVWKESEGAR